MVAYGCYKLPESDILTKKQKQMKETIKKILLAFSDKSKKEVVWRTWDEIRTYSELSNGGISKYFSMLISQGIIQIDRRKDDRGKYRNFYIYTGKAFLIKGKIGQMDVAETKQERKTMYTYAPKKGTKQPPSIPATRVYLDDSNGIKAIESGNLRRGRTKTKEKYRLNGQTENWYFKSGKMNEPFANNNVNKKEERV